MDIVEQLAWDLYHYEYDNDMDPFHIDYYMTMAEVFVRSYEERMFKPNEQPHYVEGLQFL